MPGVKIGKNVVIEKAVIGADAVIGDGAKVGVNSSDDNKYAQICVPMILFLSKAVPKSALKKIFARAVW